MNNKKCVRRLLNIDVDTGREQTIRISGVPVDGVWNPNPKLDMVILCEVLGALIRICQSQDIMSEADAIRFCIDNLKKEFINPDFKAWALDEPEDSKDKKYFFPNIKKISPEYLRGVIDYHEATFENESEAAGILSPYETGSAECALWTNGFTSQFGCKHPFFKDL